MGLSVSAMENTIEALTKCIIITEQKVLTLQQCYGLLERELQKSRGDNADLLDKIRGMKGEIQKCDDDECELLTLRAKYRNLLARHNKLEFEYAKLRDKVDTDDPTPLRAVLSDSDLAMEDAYLRKEREKRETESDTDPVTGVQYGDLS